MTCNKPCAVSPRCKRMNLLLPFLGIHTPENWYVMSYTSVERVLIHRPKKKPETIIPHLPLQALHWGEWWYFLQNLVLQERSEVIRATLLYVGVIITLQYTLPHCWNEKLNSNFPPIVHISKHYEDFIVWHILLLFQISVCARGSWQPLLFVTQLPTHKSVVDLNRLYVTITC